jgi:N-methylhydantoinase A/oxoprolinase/acetone carboxylase beta subunit
MIRGGIDIGGTFTDIVYIDDETRQMIGLKDGDTIEIGNLFT